MRGIKFITGHMVYNFKAESHHSFSNFFTNNPCTIPSRTLVWLSNKYKILSLLRQNLVFSISEVLHSLIYVYVIRSYILDKILVQWQGYTILYFVISWNFCVETFVHQNINCKLLNQFIILFRYCTYAVSLKSKRLIEYWILQVFGPNLLFKYVFVVLVICRFFYLIIFS